MCSLLLKERNFVFAVSDVASWPASLSKTPMGDRPSETYPATNKNQGIVKSTKKAYAYFEDSAFRIKKSWAI